MDSKNKQPRPDDQSPEKPKRKRVGDETPNPLPAHPYSVEQPAGDDNQANPEPDSPID